MCAASDSLQRLLRKMQKYIRFIGRSLLSLVNLRSITLHPTDFWHSTMELSRRMNTFGNSPDLMGSFRTQSQLSKKINKNLCPTECLKAVFE